MTVEHQSGAVLRAVKVTALVCVLGVVFSGLVSGSCVVSGRGGSSLGAMGATSDCDAAFCAKNTTRLPISAYKAFKAGVAAISSGDLGVPRSFCACSAARSRGARSG